MKSDDRTHIHFRIREELARANSCHIRMLYLRLCEMAIALFSKEYFKQHFFGDLINLSADIVANVRLKLCTMMPRLKSLLSLPSDKALLQRLEATVKDLLLRETGMWPMSSFHNCKQTAFTYFKKCKQTTVISLKKCKQRAVISSKCDQRVVTFPPKKCQNVYCMRNMGYLPKNRC